MNQGEISEIEHRTDIYISTLAGYVELAAQIRKDQYDFSLLTSHPPRSHAAKWALVMAA